MQVQRERQCRETVHKHHTRYLYDLGNTDQVEAKRRVMGQHEQGLRLLSMDFCRAGSVRG